MNDYLEHFLANPAVKALILQNDLTRVYSFLGHHTRMFTEYLYANDINPLDYFNDYIPTAALANVRNSPEKLTINPSVKGIQQYAFYNCENLKVIVLPKSLTMVRHKAFDKCSKLEKIYYPGTASELLANVQFTPNWSSTSDVITCTDQEVFIHN